MLLKKPGFTLVAVLSLALGIGANTAIFSLLDAVLIKTLPVEEPQQLVLFGKGEDQGASLGPPSGNVDLFSYPFYRQAQQRTDVFSGVASLLSITWTVHGFVNTSSDIEQMEVQLVSGSYFPVLGVNAGLGRVLTEADDQNVGGHPVAVVSYAWWQQRMGGDPNVIGRTIKIDETTYNIVGVAPKEFFGTTVGSAPDLWIPLAMEKQIPPAHWSIAVAPGLTHAVPHSSGCGRGRKRPQRRTSFPDVRSSSRELLASARERPQKPVALPFQSPCAR